MGTFRNNVGFFDANILHGPQKRDSNEPAPGPKTVGVGYCPANDYEHALVYGLGLRVRTHYPQTYHSVLHRLGVQVSCNAKLPTVNMFT